MIVVFFWLTIINTNFIGIKEALLLSAPFCSFYKKQTTRFNLVTSDPNIGNNQFLF